MKKARKSLALSILSMLVCVSMLIGTTLAWFTDMATSGVNKIIAGNLDVDLIMWNGTEYRSIAGEDSAIFGGENSLVAQNDSTDTLWEPGKTQIVYLGVRNNGSLALKYNIILDIIDGGLIGALEYAILDGVDASDAGFTAPASWDAIKSIPGVQTGEVVAGRIVAAQNGVLDGIAQTPKVLNETDYFALAIHMKEDADNIYMDKDITIDVTVVAGQMTAESDSFDDQYDKDAPPYKVVEVTPDSINTALQNLENNTEIILRPAYDTDGDPIPYGRIDFAQGLEPGEVLKNVMIRGSEDVVVEQILITGTDTSKGIVVENLTVSNLVFYNTDNNQLYALTFQMAGNKNILKNLVIENCTFLSTGDLNINIGVGIHGGSPLVPENNLADVIIRNCQFIGVGRPIYSTNSCYNSLLVENCYFQNIPETVIHSQGVNTTKSIIVTGNTFKDCKNRIIRPNNGANLPELTTFVFKDNTLIDCTGHSTDGYIKVTIPSTATRDLSGNVKDGLAWDITTLITLVS